MAEKRKPDRVATGERCSKRQKREVTIQERPDRIVTFVREADLAACSDDPAFVEITEGVYIRLLHPSNTRLAASLTPTERCLWASVEFDSQSAIGFELIADHNCTVEARSSTAPPVTTALTRGARATLRSTDLQTFDHKRQGIVFNLIVADETGKTSTTVAIRRKMSDTHNLGVALAAAVKLMDIRRVAKLATMLSKFKQPPFYVLWQQRLDQEGTFSFV